VCAGFGLIGALLIIALCGCETLRVSTDYDHEVDFSGYRTFSWLIRDHVPSDDVRADDPRVHTELTRAIERQLRSKGYRKRSTGTADFYVAYRLAVQMEKWERTVQRGGLRGGDRRGSVDKHTSVEFEEGTLVLDVFDPEVRKVVWRGWARSDQLRESPTPDEVSQNLNAAVAAILDLFPPE
jgi:hypothetical protein